MKTTICAFFLVFISACTSVPVGNPVIIEPVQAAIVIPPELLLDCVSLTKLDLPTYNELQLVDHITVWSTNSADCKLHHRELSDIVKKAFNIK